MSTKSCSSVKEKQGPGLAAPVRSLDRQITAQDLDCLREAFALFDADRQEEITVPELGKVRQCEKLLLLKAFNLASGTSKNCILSSQRDIGTKETERFFSKLDKENEEKL